MEDAFNKLKNEKQNDVDNLVKWLKDSKLIDSAKESEEKVRKMFQDVKDSKNIELEKFKSTVAKLAEEQKKSVEDCHKLLAAQGTTLVEALVAGAQAGATAFKNALNNADKK